MADGPVGEGSSDETLREALVGLRRRAPDLDEQRAYGAFAARLFGEPDAAVRLGERYVLGPLLGAGGVGAVYRAFDPELEREVAIKVLRVEDDGHDDAQVLLEEARTIATLSHPNVVEIYDVGLHEGKLFIVMELVSGGDLRDWLEGRPPAAEIIRRFVAAGRGLAAAHAAGLVHRDFKPANVLLRADGATKVTDFGAGRIQGTPRYMAPEQTDGAPVDARADQFSFCVTLYEALEAAHPFEPREEETSRRPAIDRGPRPPTGAARRLWSVLRRGMRADPAARFPTMDALLRSLQRRPRTRRLALVGATVLGSLGATVALLPSHVDCGDAETYLEALWGTDRQARVRAGIVAADPEQGAETFAAVAPRLHDYASAWSQVRIEACAAELDESSEVATAAERLRCLERRRRSLTTLLDVFEDADATVTERARTAVRQLPSLEGCRDPDVDEDPVALPTDPATRERVQALEVQMAAIKPLELSGRYDGALRLAEEALSQAEEIGYAPSIARASYRVGVALTFLDRHEPARTTLERAAFLALEQGQHTIVAGASAKLVALHGRLGDEDGAERWKRQGLAAVRAGQLRADIEARVYLEYGGASYRMGKYEDALEASTKAADLYAAVLSSDDPELAVAFNNIGGTLAVLGRVEEGLEYLERALEIRRATLGDRHPLIGSSFANLAAVAVELDRLDDAERYLIASERAFEGVLPADHPRRIVGLTAHARLEKKRGRAESALAILKRAEPIAARAELADLARILFLRATTLLDQRRLPEALTAAEDYLRRCVEGEACRADALATRALVLAALGRHEEARTDAEQARAAGSLDQETAAALDEAASPVH